MTTFAMYLAFEMDINPMATSLYAKLGANAGCASVLSLTGVLAKIFRSLWVTVDLAFICFCQHCFQGSCLHLLYTYCIKVIK